MRPVSRKSIVAGFLALVVPVFVAHSQQPVTLEYQVKASYLYNFVQFVEWPQDIVGSEGKFNLCVTGAERFGAALGAFSGERVDGKEIAIHRLDRNASVSSVRCHLLFIAAGAVDTDTTSMLGERGVLTIGETPGFLGRGGVINLVQVQGKIRFEISQQAARKAGLVISSRILSLAVNKP